MPGFKIPEALEKTKQAESALANLDAIATRLHNPARTIMPDSKIKLPGHPPGQHYYAIIFDQDRQVWDGSGFVPFIREHWARYAVPIAESVDEFTGRVLYILEFPVGAAPGFYKWYGHRKATADVEPTTADFGIGDAIYTKEAAEPVAAPQAAPSPAREESPTDAR